MTRVQAIRKALLDWFAARARSFPWREHPTPYHVWVSEVMLQQTQMATVLPYYRRFIARFPDVETLAAAPLDEVLKLWEGMGYYRRAHLLHQAARVVVEEYDGHLPADERALLALPGVGPYTAGARAVADGFRARKPGNKAAKDTHGKADCAASTPGSPIPSGPG